MAGTPPIIIKKKVSHGGHHGGAWKVAYADFVTAMMALFIVLWLMNSSKQIQEAVGGYFKDPTGTVKQVGSDQRGAADNFVVSKDNMEQLKEQLQSAIKAVPKFDLLKNHIDMTVTNEGLRIELSESAAGTFFDSGKAKISEGGAELLIVLAEDLGKHGFQAVRRRKQLRELGALFRPRECGAASAAAARHRAGSDHASERFCRPKIAQER
jgi:chemotaxis protein MotB